MEHRERDPERSVVTYVEQLIEDELNRQSVTARTKMSDRFDPFLIRRRAELQQIINGYDGPVPHILFEVVEKIDRTQMLTRQEIANWFINKAGSDGISQNRLDGMLFAAQAHYVTEYGVALSNGFVKVREDGIHCRNIDSAEFAPDIFTESETDFLTDIWTKYRHRSEQYFYDACIRPTVKDGPNWVDAFAMARHFAPEAKYGIRNLGMKQRNIVGADEWACLSFLGKVRAVWKAHTHHEKVVSCVKLHEEDFSESQLANIVVEVMPNSIPNRR